MAIWIQIILLIVVISELSHASKICLEPPPNNKPISECCTFPSLISPVTYEKCNAEFGMNSRMQQDNVNSGLILKGCCVAECILNASSIYKGDGLVDFLTLFRNILNSVRGDSQWEDIVYNSATTCFNEVTVRVGEIYFGSFAIPTISGEKICHPVSGFIFTCIETELFKRCPSIAPDNDCSSLQMYAQTCRINKRYGEYFLMGNRAQMLLEEKENPDSNHNNPYHQQNPSNGHYNQQPQQQPQEYHPPAQQPNHQQQPNNYNTPQQNQRYTPSSPTYPQVSYPTPNYNQNNNNNYNRNNQNQQSQKLQHQAN